MALAQATKSHETTEAGRVQTIEEAWKEIDEI